jgi:hypothetical protein
MKDIEKAPNALDDFDRKVKDASWYSRESWRFERR